jgi:hypothetical protein
MVKRTASPDSTPSNYFVEAAQALPADLLVDLAPTVSRAYDIAERVLCLLNPQFAVGAPQLSGGPLGLILSALGKALDDLRTVIRVDLGCLSQPDADYVSFLNLSDATNVALYQLRAAEKAVTTWYYAARWQRHQPVPPDALRQFEAAVALLGNAVRTAPEPVKPPHPRWVKKDRQLWYGDILCVQYRRHACHQHLILAAFEEQAWPAHIDDPLPPGKAAATIADLQERLRKMQSPIVIERDGRGTGFVWRPRSPA